jgi:hypothetical protein
VFFRNAADVETMDAMIGSSRHISNSPQICRVARQKMVAAAQEACAVLLDWNDFFALTGAADATLVGEWITQSSKAAALRPPPVGRPGE